MNHNKSQKQSEIPSWNEKDYQISIRTSDQSMKYLFTLGSKQIHTLNPNFSSQALQNRPIVCSYADMEFRFPKHILDHANKELQSMPVQFGYSKAKQKQKQILIQWIKKRYYSKINPQYVDLYGGILSLYFGIITQLTKENDQVLIFSPGYYRFLVTLKQTKRKPVQYILKTRDTKNGPQLYIDFQQLQKIFSNNKIKLVIWISPFNPTGRIWTQEQCRKIADLTLKYDSMIFADEIYGDSVLDVNRFTSMLKIEQVHNKLIWAGSFTKTFNCSGSPVSHTYIPNQEIRKKMLWYLDYAYLFPNIFSVKLMTSCYSVGQQWRVNTMKYIQNNYNYFKKQSQQKLPKLIVYTLQSSYLMMVDFKNYGMNHADIQNMMNSINIFPTYFVSCFVNLNPAQISTCRISLAINKKVLEELINRLSKAINNKI